MRAAVMFTAAKLLALLALAISLHACATTGPDPCIGSYAARLTMPCYCPGTLDDSCYPWPSDAKKPKIETTDGGSAK